MCESAAEVLRAADSSDDDERSREGADCNADCIAEVPSRKAADPELGSIGAAEGSTKTCCSSAGQNRAICSEGDGGRSRSQQGLELVLHLEFAGSKTIKAILFAMYVAIAFTCAGIIFIFVFKIIKDNNYFILHLWLYKSNLAIGCISAAMLLAAGGFWCHQMFRVWRMSGSWRMRGGWDPVRKRMCLLQGAKALLQLISLVALIILNARLLSMGTCFVVDDSHTTEWCAFVMWSGYNLLLLLLCIEANDPFLAALGRGGGGVTPLASDAEPMRQRGLRLWQCAVAWTSRGWRHALSLVLCAVIQGVLIAFLMRITKAGGPGALALRVPVLESLGMDLPGVDSAKANSTIEDFVSASLEALDPNNVKLRTPDGYSDTASMRTADNVTVLMDRFFNGVILDIFLYSLCLDPNMAAAAASNNITALKFGNATALHLYEESDDPTVADALDECVATPLDEREDLAQFTIRLTLGELERALGSCKLPSDLKGLSTAFAAGMGLYFVLYVYYIYGSFAQLVQMPYNKYRLHQLYLRYKVLLPQVRTNLVTFVVLMMAFSLEWFVYWGSCSSILVSMLGYAGVELVSTVTFLAGALLIVPFLRPQRDLDEGVAWGRHDPRNPDFSLDAALRCLHWSSVAYRTDNTTRYDPLLGCHLYDLDPGTYREFQDELRDVFGVMASGSGCVMLAFRGTKSRQNVLHDLRNYLTVHPPKRGHFWSRPKAHSGFLKCWHHSTVRDKVMQQLQATIEKHAAQANTQQPAPLPVVVTGHSLGGAIAMLAAFEIQRLYGSQVACCVYTFGVPRVGNHAFAAEYNCLVPNTMNIANDNDVIMRMGKFLYFKRPGHRVLVNRWGDLLVRPTFFERNLLQRVGGSASDHMLAGYRLALRAVLEAPWRGKGLDGDTERIGTLLIDPTLERLLREVYGVTLLPGGVLQLAKRQQRHGIGSSGRASGNGGGDSGNGGGDSGNGGGDSDNGGSGGGEPEGSVRRGMEGQRRYVVKWFVLEVLFWWVVA